MSWHLSSVLFFLLLMCCTYGPVYGVNTMKNSVDIFVPGQTKVPDKVGDLNPVKDVKFFYSPVLVGADDVMTVLASTDYTDRGNKNVDIVARYIGTHGMNWAEKVTESNGSNWKTQLVMQGEEQKLSYNYQLIRPMAATKGNKIYLLVLIQRKQTESQSWINPDWDLELTVGEVKPTSNAQLGEKTIEWQKPKLPISTLTKQLKDQSLSIVLSGGSAFLGMDERIVFVMRALKEDNDTVVVVHMNDTGKGITFEWSGVEVPEGCYFPSVFGWSKKFIMVTYCMNGGYGVKESVDMGKAWTDATGPISRLSDHWNGKQQFTTATIENKNVLFFSELRNLGTTINPQYAIHLGVTDGNRVYEAEPSVVDGKFLTSAGLLYTKSELFFLYKQSYIIQSDRVLLMHLKDGRERIKSVLRIWAKKDEYLSKPCNETAPKDALSETFCVTPMPTDGLVGFLSNRGNSTYWHDEFLFMNATVKGGTKVQNGFRFSGTGSGARWPIGKQGLDQLYDFERYGLTVVATVTIHGVPERETPLLTVSELGDKQLLGLWYDKDKQWTVMSRNGGKPVGDWEVNKTYRVALIADKKNLFAYVDGKLLWKLLHIMAPLERLFDIQHLFIGGYNGDNTKGTVSHVTVTNVFLYNRGLSKIELEALNKKMPTTPKPTNPREKLPQPTNLSGTLPQPTNPREKLPQPTNLSETLPQPTNPREKLPQPTNPREKLPQPTNLSGTLPQPTNPREKLPQPTNPREKLPQPINLSETLPQPTNPREKLPQPINPREKLPQPTNPREKLPQPTNPREKLPQPTNLSGTLPQPTNPREKLPQPTNPREKLPQPINLSETLPQPTNPREKLPQPINPREKLPQPTNLSGTLPRLTDSSETLKPKGTGDSSVHVSVVATLLFLLTLWDFAGF